MKIKIGSSKKKSEKKVSKKSKGDKKAVYQKKPVTDELSAKAKKLVTELDEIEALNSKRQDLLSQLKKEIGGTMFKHPKTKKVMAVMRRGKVWFIRPAPGH